MWIDLLKADVSTRGFGRSCTITRGPGSRRTEDGVLLLSAKDFHERLSAGDLF